VGLGNWSLFCHYCSVPGGIKGIEGEGMPHYRNPFEKGNLYIKFDVTFPESHFTNEIKLKVCFYILYFSEVLLWAV
jgi:DnaJ-class molecular chaperone